MGDDAAPAASLENFDDQVGSFGGADDAEPAGTGPGEGRGDLGSVLDHDALDEPHPSIDPVTGRAMDGPGEMPEDETAEQPEGEDGDAQDGEEGAEGEDAEQAPEYPWLAKEAQEALQEGRIPEALMGHTVRQKIAGEESEIPLSEAVENGMRQLDYSRRVREFTEDKREFDESFRQPMMQMVGAWKMDTPEARTRTRQELEMLGVPVLEIARDLADEAAAEATMTEGERMARAEARRVAREKQELEYRLQAIERQQKQRPDETRQKAVETVNKLRPAALQAVGLKDTRNIQALFHGHLGAVWDRSSPITQTMVNDAARATRQELEENGLAVAAPKTGKPAGNGARPAQPQRRGLSPRPAGGAGGGSRQTRDGQGRFVPKPESFDDFMERRR